MLAKLARVGSKLKLRYEARARGFKRQDLWYTGARTVHGVLQSTASEERILCFFPYSVLEFLLLRTVVEFPLDSQAACPLEIQVFLHKKKQG